MGRYQSPLVKHDLSRLEDPEGRQIALTSLKSCVRNLEPESMAFFLDQIAEAHQNPYVISLYEDIARAHRTLLVPYIPRVMEALISVLSESGSSLHVHEACGKVVACLSKHSIDMARLGHQAKDVLRLLCEPLLCVLVGKFEPVSTGAAVCLTALVESENWSHAPRELVNEVCFRVVAAVSGKSATVAHLQLAVTVARVNREMMESFGVELLVGGREILNWATSWNLRVAAAQLLNSALSLVDGVALSQEIASVIEVLDRHRLDRMPKVRSAVAEALKTARACCSNVGATTKMIFSVGDSRRGDPGIGSILTPGFQTEYSRSSKRDPTSRTPSVVSRNQRLRKGGGVRPPPEEPLGVEFVIVEEHRPQPCPSPRRSGRRGGESPKVRHTISAEPGGYVIQEWIKVEDRFPGCGMLAGIDEGEEYYYEPPPEFYSAMSPGERQVVIFDEDHAATTRLIEESELATIPEEPPSSSCSTGDCLPLHGGGGVESSGETLREEWSVRNNPIAAKSEGGRGGSVTPFQAAEEAEALLMNQAGDDASSPEQQQQQQQEEQPLEATSTTVELGSEAEPEVKPDDESSLDSVASVDGSLSKMNASDELVDTFRRNWEVLECTVEQQVPDVVGGGGESPVQTTTTTTTTCVSGDQLVKAISSSFIQEEQEVVEESSLVVETSEIVVTQCSEGQQAPDAEVGGLRRNSVQDWIWRKVQSSVEKLVAGSVCAAILLPATMALIKSLEQSSIDLVPT